MPLIRQVYLDHSATTPTDPQVIDAMMPYFTEHYGNTSSAHGAGRKAEDAVETARETIAHILNCKPSEIIFTSGGSESDNLAIRGAGWARFERGEGNHLITTSVEHNAITNTIKQMTNLMGFEGTVLPIDQQGIVDIEDFVECCRETTTVASIIYANNEVGTISPIALLAEQARAHNVLFHTDAVQAGGQLTLDVNELGVDMMSISAHKFYGPKGVGALYCRDGLNLHPSQTGGSHEDGRRAGTLNTPGIVGMAKALELAYTHLDEHVSQYQLLRDRLMDEILLRVPDSYLTGHPERRLPSHASFVFENIDSSMLLMHLDMSGVYASGASACKTGNPEPSSVLLALGYEPELAASSLRLTVGRSTTEEGIDFAVDTLVTTIEKLRKLTTGNLL